MAHVESKSVEYDGKVYLEDKHGVRIGGPFASNDEADRASMLASRLLGEQSTQVYKQFVNAWLNSSEEAKQGFERVAAAKVTPNFPDKEGNIRPQNPGLMGSMAHRNNTMYIKPESANNPNIWQHEGEHKYFVDQGIHPKDTGLLDNYNAGLDPSQLDPRIGSDSHFLIYNRPVDETRMYQNPKVRFDPKLRNYNVSPFVKAKNKSNYMDEVWDFMGGLLDIGSPYMRFKAQKERDKIKYKKKKSAN
jgi:hypothetical protein